MKYEDLKNYVEAKMQSERDLEERLRAAVVRITTELRRRFEFPTAANGSVEAEGQNVTVTINFQRRTEEERKQGVHVLKCEVEIAEENGRVVAHIDKTPASFQDLETAEGLQKFYDAVDSALKTKVDIEKWLQPPPRSGAAAKG
jgi:hypothetical protein